MRKQKSLTRLDDVADTLFSPINNNVLIVLKGIVKICKFEKTKCLVLQHFFIEQKSLSN